MGKRENIDTKCQKVLELLIEHKRHPEKGYNIAEGYGNEWIYSGWLPIYAFTKPFIGGSSGGKRERELRYKFHIPIEMKIHEWEYSGKKMRTPVYRLGCEPEEIDLKNIRRIKKEKYEQSVLI